MKIYKIGIIGCGHIAEKMATTLNAMPDVECYAVASRSLQKAGEFASKWNFSKAYGSYEALADDPAVNLIYIATPHALHFEQAMMCIGKGKPVLCEKSFTANAAQAEKLIDYAHKRGVFITEAIWTRYLPFSRTICDLVDSGIIGKPATILTSLSYPVAHKERIMRPELAGGALLDLGVYTLNFAAMVFGTDIVSTHSVCRKTDTGVDGQESITLFYRDGKMATLQSSIYARSDRQGIISGEKGHIIVDNINCPLSAKVYGSDYKLIAEYHAPEQITGFEYQVHASIQAIENGALESPFMPHGETLRIMHQMDELRRSWGVVFPCD